jgi:uncharacterized protein (TIGR03437 family)
LQSASPLINAGVSISTLNGDRDGVTRPQGGAFDIGAYESCTAPPPAVNQGGVVNSASFALHPSPLAPGSIAAVFGGNLTICAVILNTAFAPNGRLLTSLGGTEVRIDGVLAPMFYATPSQLGIQIPMEVAGRPTATFQVMAAGQTSAAHTIFVDAASPGIFTVNQQGTGTGAITHSNGSQITAVNPARPGEIVVLYATGLGPLTPPLVTGAASSGNQTAIPATVTVDGVAAEVLFSGSTPGLVGLNQINFRIPLSTRPAIDVPIVLSVGGKQSNSVMLPVSP